MRPDVIESPRLTSRWDRVANQRIHTRAAEDQAPAGAPAVVLVHGLGMSSRYMVPTAERLAHRSRVYAPDLPGFGLSDSPSRVLNIAESAEFLGVWIETLGLDRPALVANSVGCQIAIDLAMKRPTLLDRIVLQGPTMARGRRSWAWQFLRQRQNDRQEPSSLKRLNTWDYRDTGRLRLFWTMEFAMWDRPERKLPFVTVPALVVRGGRDPICPQSWAEEVTRRLPRGRLVVVPEATHTMNYVQPDRLTEVIRPFLDEDRVSP